jgi:uncharacterized protein YegL
MICPSCGIENLNNAKFCKKCGFRIEITAPNAPARSESSPPPDVASNTNNPNQIKIIKTPPSTYRKPIHYIWICDCSESMQLGGKMNAVNNAIPKAIESISQFEDNSNKARIFMNALKFSCGAEWMYNDNIPVKSFQWENLNCEGITDLGHAFLRLAKLLKLQKDGGKMPEKAYPPVLVLITDGYPTDDWESGLKELNKEFWAKNAVRLAFALEGADREVLEEFIGGDEIDKQEKIIEIRDLTKLASEIKDKTTTYGQEKIRDRMPPGR